METASSEAPNFKFMLSELAQQSDFYVWESHWKVAEITISSLKVYPKNPNKTRKTMRMTDGGREEVGSWKYTVSN